MILCEMELLNRETLQWKVHLRKYKNGFRWDAYNFHQEFSDVIITLVKVYGVRNIKITSVF